MGEYIKKANRLIKIGVLDHLWLTREELIRLRMEGYQGFYAGDYNREIEGHLSSDDRYFLSPIYTLTDEQRKERELLIKRNDLYPFTRNSERLVKVSFPVEVSVSFEHTNNCSNRGLCKSEQEDVFLAVIICEAYRKGKPRTVFSCVDCDAWFSVSSQDLGQMTFVNSEHGAFFPMIYSNEDFENGAEHENNR